MSLLRSIKEATSYGAAETISKVMKRSQRDTWGLRESLILQRTGVWFSEPAVLFMTTHNSNPRGSNTIVWPLGTPGIYMVHTHTYMHASKTQMYIKLIIINK